MDIPNKVADEKRDIQLSFWFLTIIVYPMTDRHALYFFVNQEAQL